MADQVMRFTLSGKRFDFDCDPTLLTGDQTEIIRRRSGMSAMAFLRAGLNITSDNFDDQTLLVLAYLAAYRKNELIEWDSFIRTVAPFTLDFVPDPVDDDSGTDDSTSASETADTTAEKAAPATRRAPRKAPAKK